jgi:hypothetical protein
MPNDTDWYFITEQIYQKKFVPIISNQVIHDSLFGSDSVVPAWADNINYPLADNGNLTRVAQFLSVTIQDPTRARSSYLQFLKQSLLELARMEPDASQSFLDQVKSELRGLTFSQLATERLRCLDFKEETDNPLSILAALDIPIYLTTSYHRFMEAALRAAGKTSHTEVYCWRETLEANIPPGCKADPDFAPDVQSPLVYHLHGIDDYPDSLVLTEDDYLEFLVNVTQDFNTDAIPSTVRNALSSSLLLILGYDLNGWDLRVLLHGLIKGKPLRPRSVAIQIMPGQEDSIKDTAQFREYLQKYFGQVRFDVYWGAPQTFMKNLWAEWEKG